MHAKRWFCAAAAMLLLTMSACGQAQQPPETTIPPAEQTTQAEKPRQAEADMAAPGERPAAQTQAASAQAAQDTTTAAQSAAQDADIGPLFRKFVRERVDDGVYTMRTKQSGLTLITTFSGEDTVLESDAAGLLQLTLIHKGGEYYMVCGSTKKYVALTAEEYEKQAGKTLQNAALQLGNMHLKQTGEQTVGGRKYSTETYDEGDLGTVTYFFDESGLRRSTIDKGGTITQIETMEILDEADPAAFEIPQGYTRITDPAQLFTV